MNKTTIEWTDTTWNFLRGCSRVSAGCENCYAETIARRFSGPGLPYEGTISERGKWNGNITLHEDKLLEVLRWKKPQKVFVNSMSDLFHENVKDEWIDKAFAVMALTPHIQYQILTKRPERMKRWFTNAPTPPVGTLNYKFYRQWHVWAAMSNSSNPELANAAQYIWNWDIKNYGIDGQWPLPNVWLGVSVEDQKTADERIPLLLQTPAAVRFLSLEPLLGEIDLKLGVSFLGGSFERYDKFNNFWVIVGGESGPNARPVHPDWVRSIRDQCVAAGVPFFFKQWGEWKRRTAACVLTDDSVSAQADEWEISGRLAHFRGDPDNKWFYRLGKKKAGRLLDGRTWDEFPK